jgi:hypothetical protein
MIFLRFFRKVKVITQFLHFYYCLIIVHKLCGVSFYWLEIKFRVRRKWKKRFSLYVVYHFYFEQPKRKLFQIFSFFSYSASCCFVCLFSVEPTRRLCAPFCSLVDPIRIFELPSCSTSFVLFRNMPSFFAVVALKSVYFRYLQELALSRFQFAISFSLA